MAKRVERPIKHNHSGRKQDFEAMTHHLSPEHDWLKLELARLNVKPDDPIGPILKVILQCSDNMGSLPEMSDEVKTNLRDFKATVYDMQRQSDHITHLLQRSHHSIQVPLSRAMWATFFAGLAGTIIGAIAVGIFLVATNNADCNPRTGQCEQLRLEP